MKKEDLEEDNLFF